MAAFAPGEVQQPVMGGDGVLLHCTSSSGYMYEMLMSGVVRNFARDPASPEDGDGGAEMARGWHVCADSKAKLVVSGSSVGGVLVFSAVGNRNTTAIAGSHCPVLVRNKTWMAEKHARVSAPLLTWRDRAPTALGRLPLE